MSLAPGAPTVPQEMSWMLGTDLRVSRYPLFNGTRLGTDHRALSMVRKSRRTMKQVKTDPIASLISRSIVAVFPLSQADPTIHK